MICYSQNWNINADCLPSVDVPNDVSNTDDLTIAPPILGEMVNNLQNICEGMNDNILVSYNRKHELLKSQLKCIEKLVSVSNKVVD